MESKRYNNFMNITKISRLIDIKNQVVVTSREREEKRDSIRAGD